MRVESEFPFKITAVMIVKDAETTIRTALKSLLSVCGQIIVVDTGSSDKTPSICMRMGAELHFFKWCDDFSAARNYGLQFVRGEWILVLDADEEVDINSIKGQGHLFSEQRNGGLRIRIVNYLDNNDLSYTSEHYYTRIFRNHPNFKFSGKIHEQIQEAILSEGFTVVNSPITIKHYGYIETGKNKTDRNKNLLLQEIEKNPNDIWLKYHLAETEFSAHNFQEAKEIFSMIFDSDKLSVEQKEMSRLRLAQIALYNNDFDEVHNRTNFISTDLNKEGLRKYILAAGLIYNRKFDSALEYLNSAEVLNSSLINKEKLKEAKEVIYSVKLF